MPSPLTLLRPSLHVGALPQAGIAEGFVDAGPTCNNSEALLLTSASVRKALPRLLTPYIDKIVTRQKLDPSFVSRS